MALATTSALGYIGEAVVNDVDRPRFGNEIFGTFGRDFRTRDGRFVMICIFSDRHVDALAAAGGFADDFRRIEAETGVDLKSEALGLALSLELPLVLLDVQRGGPSTGLPTKTEQADLLLAMRSQRLNHGSGQIILIEALNTTLKTTEDVDGKLNLPVLGILPCFEFYHRIGLPLGRLRSRLVLIPPAGDPVDTQRPPLDHRPLHALLFLLAADRAR